MLIAVWLMGLYAVHWTTQPGGGGGSPMVHGERERCVDSHMADGVVFCALDDSARGGGGAALWYMERERERCVDSHMADGVVFCALDDSARWGGGGGGGGQPFGTWRKREMC